MAIYEVRDMYAISGIPYIYIYIYAMNAKYAKCDINEYIWFYMLYMTIHVICDYI